MPNPDRWSPARFRRLASSARWQAGLTRPALLLAASAVILLSVCMFLLGRLSTPAIVDQDTLTSLRAQASQLKAEQEADAVRAGEYAIIQQASSRLQEDNRELLASMSALEDRVVFYKRMAAPAATRQRVDIEHFELLPSTRPGHVRYRLLVTRPQGSDAPATAAIRVRVSGGGRQQDLSLAQPRFQFRYYQQFSGEWAVPASFQPERIDIQLRSGAAAADRRFKWELKTP